MISTLMNIVIKNREKNQENKESIPFLINLGNMIFKNRLSFKDQLPIFQTVQYLSVSNISQQISIGIQR